MYYHGNNVYLLLLLQKVCHVTLQPQKDVSAMNYCYVT